MKTQHPKIKNPPRPLFSCGIFGHCTQTVLSPTAPQPPHNPPHPDPDPPPPPPPPRSSSDPQPPSSSSSSSSSTSQSFTQWRFPLPKPPLHHYDPPLSPTPADKPSPPRAAPSPNLAEIYHAAELHLSSGSDDARLAGLHLLERSLVPDPLPDDSAASTCPPPVMGAVVGFLKRPQHAARAATKVLLALCLAEGNRRAAVEAGAVSGVVESVTEMEGSAAERALAALELLCTVPEGAAELRAHALAVPALVEMMGKMGGRGKECAISALAAIFGGAAGENPPTGVAQAVLLALQGECSARGRRKGAQLLKAVQENGRPDAAAEEGR